jgi:hypothetical protein
VWNLLEIEGLLAYGFRTEAALVFTRLMAGITNSLKSFHSFYSGYDSDNGSPSGERNSLNGLAPMGLFLEILGLKFMAGNSILLTGNNPFPWPITVKYRGTTVTRQEKETHIVFPDGQSIDVHGSGSYVISLA